MNNRVTRVNYTRYAVTNPKGNFASVRAEQTRSFSRNFGSKSQNFVKKMNKYHAAAGKSGHYRAQTSRLDAYRVTRVIYRSPGFSRLNACRGRGIRLGPPDPAEAGTPERRYLD
jgi:hypothetical protein